MQIVYKEKYIIIYMFITIFGYCELCKFNQKKKKNNMKEKSL